MNALQLREKFETWFRREHHNRLSRNMPDKSYNCPIAHSKWEAWKGCAVELGIVGEIPNVEENN